MTEKEAQDWLRNNFDVPRETWQQLEAFLKLLAEEMERQNLISKSSADHIWDRHVVDSAQLLLHAPHAPKLASGGGADKLWLDLGTGAGFPGIIIAILGDYKVEMVESRARRIAFLESVVHTLGLTEKALVFGSRLETVETHPVDVISARAFAPLPKLLSLSHRFSTENTVWLLPKGKNAVRELKGLSPKRQKMFHVEQSLTDPQAGILVGIG